MVKMLAEVLPFLGSKKGTELTNTARTLARDVFSNYKRAVNQGQFYEKILDEISVPEGWSVNLFLDEKPSKAEILTIVEIGYYPTQIAYRVDLDAQEFPQFLEEQASRQVSRLISRYKLGKALIRHGLLSEYKTVRSLPFLINSKVYPINHD